MSVTTDKLFSLSVFPVSTISIITSDNPIIGAISIDPFNFINSTSRFIESKYFLATFVNFVATTSGLSKSSTNPFSAAIENLHFPNPKSNNSYTLGHYSLFS